MKNLPNSTTLHNMKKRDLLLVEFNDIGADNSWFNETEARKDCTPVWSCTVGWKLGSDDKKILNLASFRNEIGRCCNVVSIPKGCILKITKLA